MLFSAGSPRHARKIFTMHWRWANRAFTMGVPGGTIGALIRYESSDRTLWNFSNSVAPCLFTSIRSEISAR